MTITEIHDEIVEEFAIFDDKYKMTSNLNEVSFYARKE